MARVLVDVTVQASRFQCDGCGRMSPDENFPPDWTEIPPTLDGAVDRQHTCDVCLQALRKTLSVQPRVADAVATAQALGLKVEA